MEPTLFPTIGATINKVRRIVWDGAQVAWELQFNGTGAPVPPETEPVTWDTAEYTGRVGYVNGGDLDHPLGVLRYNYISGNSYWPSSPVLIIPHYNWRGAAVYPTFVNGEGASCISSSPTQCVAVAWPGYWPSYWQTPYLEVSWQGSFADQSTQGSGLQYKRNRWYDPNTGRFTQEDPIGLAGGINAYGFAAGDPISFSDPLGLCPPGMSIPACIEYLAKSSDLSKWVSKEAHDLQEEKAALGRSWTTQREAFWKQASKAEDAVNNWSERNIDRMSRGRAPKLPNAAGKEQSAELSHEPIPQRNGGTQVVPRTPEQHANVDEYRRLPPNDLSEADVPIGTPITQEWF